MSQIKETPASRKPLGYPSPLTTSSLLLPCNYYLAFCNIHLPAFRHSNTSLGTYSPKNDSCLLLTFKLMLKMFYPVSSTRNIKIPIMPLVRKLEHLYKVIPVFWMPILLSVTYVLFIALDGGCLSLSSSSQLLSTVNRFFFFFIFFTR